VLSADGDILLYNTESLTIIRSLTGIPRPSYITLDTYNNIWFTHSLSGLGHYNFTTNNFYLWSIGENIIPVSSIDLFKTDSIYNTDELIGGLSTDVYNRIWIIDAYNHTVRIILSADVYFKPEDVRDIKIRPNSTLGYYVDVNTGLTFTESNPNYRYKSAQAFGDWTGNKWYQKYVTTETLSSKVLFGESTPFNIRPFKNENEVVITESISVSLFGNDNSIVRVRNWKLSDLHRKITKGVKLVDYKTKWSWYDLRISIHGDSQMNNLADSIEEWYFKVGERKELLDIASEAGIDAHLESNQEIIEILEEKGLWN
jgi:hypothetical protein